MGLKLLLTESVRFYLNLVVIGLIIYIGGCSPALESGRKEETARYEKKKFIKNLDAEERAYIKSAKISSIEKISFDLDENGKPLTGEKLSTLNYNPDGFLNETIIYDENGDIKYRFTYDYDKSGRRIKTSRFINGKLTNYYTYEYDQYGNKTKAFRYNTNEELEEYYLYEYDNEGNLLEEEWFSYNGDRVYSIENEYNNGRKTHSYTYDGDNYLVYEYVFRYDDKGNVIEELKYNGRGIQSGVIQYIYKYY